MTSISELVNTIRDVTVGGKTLKMRQLKIKELFAHFENKSIEAKINEARKISDVMDGEDKITFMMRVWDNLPKGESLTEMATESMTTLNGVVDMIYMASKDLNDDLTPDDVSELISLQNINELGSVIKWISGFEGLPDAEETEGVDGNKKK